MLLRTVHLTSLFVLLLYVLCLYCIYCLLFTLFVCTSTGVGFFNFIRHVYSDNKGILFHSILFYSILFYSLTLPVREGFKRENYGRGGGPKCSYRRPDQENKWRALLKS